MYINEIKPINLNFGSAQMNIVSMADSHGDILSIPHVIKTIHENKTEIFDKKSSPSTHSILAIVGDYYMNPGGRGILTSPRKTFGDIQHAFLEKLIFEVKRNFAPTQKFDTLYTPGNHCFGAGDEWLFDRLIKAPMYSLITNVNLEKSPLIDKISKKVPTILPQKIFEIPDSQNPELKNHVLFLGVTTPSMYYNIGNIKHTAFYDQTTKNDVLMNEEDFKETLALLNKSIEDYKRKYPRGAVVLMMHTGNRISNMFANNVKGIDVILNAHDHKDYSSFVNGTQIFSHGQNNKFIRSLNLMFDDNGKLSCIKNQKFDTAPHIKSARKDSYLQRFVRQLLKKDLKPLVYIDKEGIKQEDLLFSNDIRHKNTVLGNFITFALGKEARKVYHDLDSIAIPSTIIRNGLLSNSLRTTFNNIDLLNMFKGVDTNVSKIRLGKITGQELLDLILENTINNLSSPTRNALILWSDIQINRTAVKKLIKSGRKNDLASAIKIRNKNTGKFEQINPDKIYKIILADKYLVKKTKNIKVAEKIFSKFRIIPETYRLLFKRYLDSSSGKLEIPKESYEKRII